MRLYEVMVVGAGPIGLELAVALKRAGLDYAQLDAGQVGSTISWWAPGTRFFSSPERIEIAGVPLVTPTQDKATREEYLAYLRQVAAQFRLRVDTRERVVDLRRTDEGFALETESARHGRRTRRAVKVVLAIGDMHRPRLIGVPGEGLPHVSHYLRDPHEYFGRRVLIVGGKNSAVEAAIRLHRVGARVTISYRGAEFSDRVKYWLRPELLWLIKKDAIGFLPRTVVREIEPDRVVLEELGEGGGPGRTFDETPDDVLLLTGYEQDATLFERAGVELEGQNRAPVHSRRTMETNVPGLFVAGTAAAGTQVGGVKVFIETSHVHVRRIVTALTGEAVSDEELADPEYSLPES